MASRGTGAANSGASPDKSSQVKFALARSLDSIGRVARELRDLQSNQDESGQVCFFGHPARTPATARRTRRSRGVVHHRSCRAGLALWRRPQPPVRVSGWLRRLARHCYPAIPGRVPGGSGLRCRAGSSASHGTVIRRRVWRVPLCQHGSGFNDGFRCSGGSGF